METNKKEKSRYGKKRMKRDKIDSGI